MPQPFATAVGAPQWVIVRVPKAGRWLCSAHTQAGQVTRTGPIRMRVRETEQASRGRA